MSWVVSGFELRGKGFEPCAKIQMRNQAQYAAFLSQVWITALSLTGRRGILGQQSK